MKNNIQYNFNMKYWTRRRNKNPTEELTREANENVEMKKNGNREVRFE